MLASNVRGLCWSPSRIYGHRLRHFLRIDSTVEPSPHSFNWKSLWTSTTSENQVQFQLLHGGGAVIPRTCLDHSAPYSSHVINADAAPFTFPWDVTRSQGASNLFVLPALASLAISRRRAGLRAARTRPAPLRRVRRGFEHDTLQAMYQKMQASWTCTHCLLNRR